MKINTVFAQWIDFTVKQGDTFQFKIDDITENSVAIDFTTGYTALMQIKEALDDTLPIVEVKETLNTNLDQIVLGDGVIDIYISSTSMSLLVEKKYYFGLQLTKTTVTPNVVTTWLEGTMISKEDIP